jgi:uncharacterized protein
LDIQELDTRLDQLAHQLANLPETKDLDTLSRDRSEIDDQVRDARIRVDDLTREQKKSDADVEQVKSRRTRDRDRMDQGLVSNPKDLERMQQELVSLNRRISELEDIELDVMEQLETAQNQLRQLTAQLEEIDAKAADLLKSRDARSGHVDEQLEQLTAQRKQAASGMPDDLMTVYSRLREQRNGVGAAALRARQCGGCSLELTAADLRDIGLAAFDEVLRCEECNRILVRTSESGV